MKVLYLLVVAITSQSLAESVIDGTTLIGVTLLHRHGDRTPTSASTAEYSTDPVGVIAASEKYGYGQLTDAGKRRAYKLGQTIRARYDSLLAPQYNKSEMYIRSTDSTRTKMTVLTAMAAVYPAYPGSWSDEINWVPTPFTTVPTKYDFDLFFLNCPAFLTGYNTLLYSTSSRMDPYFDVLNIVSEAIGYNITQIPIMAYTLYDIYVSQQSLGVPLSDEIAAIMPQLEEAAGVAADLFLGNENYITYQGGVVLDAFLSQADSLINGTDTQLVRIYSAHDFNVYSFETVAQVVPRQGYPEYAAAFGLELRKVDETGDYVVLPVYQKTPGAKPVYLSVAGCGDSVLCDYTTFKQIVSPYVLDEDTWRTECGFTDDLEIDDSSIA